MWFADQTREQFLEFLQKDIPASDATFIEDIRNANGAIQQGKLRLIWNEAPRGGNLPSLIVINERDRLSFFAWVNTYLYGWRPISSLFRIIVDSDLQKIRSLKSTPKPMSGYGNVVLGMIFSEATTHVASVNGRFDKSKLSVNACLATCSFVLGQAVSFGWGYTTDLVENWFLARKITRQPTLNIDLKTLLEPWSVILEVGKFTTKLRNWPPISNSIREICYNLHINGEIDRFHLEKLTKGWPGLRDAFGHMDGPREDRVRSFESVLSTITRKRRSIPQSVVFCCGLLASRVAPGSLEHAGLLVPYLNSMKGLMLWYGLCAGMTPESKLANYSDSLGRRILRDMGTEDTIFSKPRCDISVEELDVLSVSEISLRSIRNSIPGKLIVEISPCVNALIRWPATERTHAVTQRSLFEDKTRDFETALLDLNHSLERIRDLDRSLEKVKRRFESIKETIPN